MHLICPITTSLAVIPILVVMTVNKFFICYIAVILKFSGMCYVNDYIRYAKICSTS